MKKIFDSLTWLFLVVFFLPTTLIVASWNSLPGDSLYSVKLGLESTLLFFARPSYAASSKLSVKYTERRFSEARRLLSDKASVEGLPYLERQVAATKLVIDRAPNQTAKKELARTYLVTLRDVTAQLEKEKQTIISAPPEIDQHPEPTPETQDQTNDYSDPWENSTETNDSVVADITQTQENIEETIEDLEDISEQPTVEEETPAPEPTQENTPIPEENGNKPDKENEDGTFGGGTSENGGHGQGNENGNGQGQGNGN